MQPGVLVSSSLTKSTASWCTAREAPSGDSIASWSEQHEQDVLEKLQHRSGQLENLTTVFAAKLQEMNEKQQEMKSKQWNCVSLQEHELDAYLAEVDRRTMDPIQWGPLDVANWASQNIHPIIGPLLFQKGVNGKTLICIKEPELEKMGVHPSERRTQLLTSIRNLLRQTRFSYVDGAEEGKRTTKNVQI